MSETVFTASERRKLHLWVELAEADMFDIQRPFSNHKMRVKTVGVTVAKKDGELVKSCGARRVTAVGNRLLKDGKLGQAVREGSLEFSLLPAELQRAILACTDAWVSGS